MADIVYIEQGYYEGDNYFTYTADAEVALNANVSVSCTATNVKSLSSDLSGVFTPTLTATVVKNHTSAIDSYFNFNITASRIAGNQSTLDSIVTLSLQGDRFRNTEISFPSSFTQSTQADRIQTAQSTHNAEFTQVTQAIKLLNAQSDLTSAFTITTQADRVITVQSDLTFAFTINTQVDKFLNAQSDQTSAFTINAQANKLLNALSDQSFTFAIQVDISKIITAQVNLSDIFNAALTADVTKNHTANLNSISEFICNIGKIINSQTEDFNNFFSITVIPQKTANILVDSNFAFTINAQVEKISANNIALDSTFDITVLGARIRFTNTTINAEFTQTVQIDRIRSTDASIQSSANLIADIGKIVQASVTINSAFEPTLTVTVFRNHTAALTAEFAIQITVQKFVDITGSLASAFDINATADRFRSTLITVESISSLNGVILRIRPLNSALISESVVQSTATKIQQFAVDLSAVFTPTFNIIIYKNHTAAISSAFGIECTVSVTKAVDVAIQSDTTLSCESGRIRYININNIEFNFAQSTTVNKIAVVLSNQNSEFNSIVNVGKIIQFNVNLDSVINAVLTAVVNRSNIVDLSSAFEVITQVNKTTGYNSNISTESTVQITYTRLRLLNQGIGANFTMLTQETRIKSLQANITDAFNATMTVALLRDNSITMNTASTLSCDLIRIRPAEISIQDAFVTQLTVNISRDNTITATVTVTQSTTVNKIAGVISTISIASTADVTGARIRFFDIDLIAVSTLNNVPVNRTASAQANIEDAFVTQMTVGIVLGTTINLTSTTEFTVLGTRVRLLNQGIGAMSTLVTQVDRIIQVNADLSSTVTTTGTVDRIRSVNAQFTDVFTAQMSITVSVNLVATLDTAFAFTAIPSRLLDGNAVIASAFSISTAINGSFAITATVTAQSTVLATVGLRKTAQSNITARFSRVLNQGVTRSVTITDTETPNAEYGAVGSAAARFAGNNLITISNMPTIGTGDYTIEMLAHRSAEMGDGSTFTEQDLFNADMVFRGYGVAQLGPHIYIGNDDEIKAGNTYIFEGDQITTGAFKFQTDDNLHIALVRHNAQTRLYVNGVQRGDTLSDTVPWTSTEWALGDVFLGYVDEFRVSNTARYTTNFSNLYPTPAQGTPFVPDANTIIYLSFDTVIDEPICSISVQKTTSVNLQSQASRIVTEGGVTVSAVSKFGDNSVQFDGVNDRITILNQPALGTGNFTIEMFFRRSLAQNDSAVMTLMQMYDDADSTISDELSININTNEQVQYVVRGDVKLVSNRIFDITDWHRVTVVRQNNVTKMWLDNQFTGDSFFDNNPINSNQVYVGNNQNLTLPFKGYVDDLQINPYSRFTTQHSTNSALPDQPYQLVGDGSSLMLHFNSAVIDLPLVEVSTVNRPAIVSISSVFTPSITINTEINVAITFSSAITFTCAVGVRKTSTAALTAQSQLVVISDRIIQIDSNFAVSSNITATGDLVKLFVVTAQSISSVNVTAVSTRSIQSDINTATTLNTTVNQTAGAVIDTAVNVSTQATVTRIQTAISNITANGAVNAQITRIHPGVAAITVNHTVSAQAQKTVDSAAAITTIATQTVLVGEIVQFSCAIQTEAVTLTVAVRTGDFFVNMDSAFGLIADVSRTRLSSAQFNSAIEFAVTDFRFKQFEAELSTISTQSTTVSRTRPATVNVQTNTDISIIILRIKSSSTEIAVSTTHTVTARKTGSGAAILVGTFTITAEPQPLNQILTVVRATSVSTFVATVRKVFLEEYEYLIREEVRTLNIVQEQRDYLIVEEQRTLTIQGAE